MRWSDVDSSHATGHETFVVAIRYEHDYMLWNRYNDRLCQITAGNLVKKNCIYQCNKNNAIYSRNEKAVLWIEQ
jgi:hypothetical protein